MSPPALGLRANARQFALLVLVNGLVGALVGVERSVLPAVAEREYGLFGATPLLGFLVAFGLGKASANYLAGRLADRWGRRPVLLWGWLLSLPAPLLLGLAPTWGGVVAANLLLGVGQGLAWSTTVVMKINLAGPRRRGLAMGLNELAGYVAVAASAAVSAALAERYGLRLAPAALGLAAAASGLLLSVAFVRETRGHVELGGVAAGPAPSARATFLRTTLTDPALSGAVQAGFVNNLNDGVAWGLFPALFASAGLGLAELGALVALYPAVWGLTQLGTGALSDRVGRHGLIAAGMAVQAVGLGVVAAGEVVPAFALGQALLGLGTALVYPTLLAAVADGAPPAARASTVGVYRLWRDLGYVAGALVGGLLADGLGLRVAVALVALLTLASGLVAGLRMAPTRRAAQPQP